MSDYDIRTLARLTHLKPRTVRLYVAEKLLPKPVFRGAKTTYGDEHLIRIKAVQHLLHGERLSFPQIRARLSKLSLAEIDAMTPKVVPVAEVAPATERARRAPIAVAMTPPDGHRLTAALLPSSAERWDRIPLLPGLELHIRGNAGAIVRRIAAEIASSYAVEVDPKMPAG